MTNLRSFKCLRRLNRAVKLTNLRVMTRTKYTRVTVNGVSKAEKLIFDEIVQNEPPETVDISLHVGVIFVKDLENRLLFSMARPRLRQIFVKDKNKQPPVVTVIISLHVRVVFINDFVNTKVNNST